MDCAKFVISIEEESWIGDNLPVTSSNNFLVSQFQSLTFHGCSQKVSIDNVATPIVALLSGYLQHKLGPKVRLATKLFFITIVDKIN